MSEDGEWMARVQRGDEAALGALMEKWEQPVKRLLARMVLNMRDAEELAQETFVRVWTQRARFRSGAEFRPWLFSIAVNLARNRLRWWRRRPSVSLEEWSETREMGDGSGEMGTAALERTERAAAVRDAIAALPVEMREVVALSEYEQLSHAEIAMTLGTSAKAVESRLYRAREKLRVALLRWR